MDRLYQDLHGVKGEVSSIHLGDFPDVEVALIDLDLEERMDIAQRVSSMVLSIRKKEKVKVRQPLQKIMVPILSDEFRDRIKKVESLILSEVNVKTLECLEDSSGVLVKKAKANFKRLGPRYGKQMKAIAGLVADFSNEDIGRIEKNGSIILQVEGMEIHLELEDIEISTQDIPGWTVAVDGDLIVAVDLAISEELKNEGIAREMVNRIQNLRKESGLAVTDRISLRIERHEAILQAIESNKNYICSETLAGKLDVVELIDGGETVSLDEQVSTRIQIEKLD
jgi:isoleucyl-tRNA synthetase